MHTLNLLSRQKGFTLLEVMVALIFFSLIGIVLQQVTASTLTQYDAVRKKTFSTWIAQNKLAELRLSEGLPAAKEYKEDVKFAAAEWQLVSRVQTTNNPDIHRVDIDVHHVDETTDDKQKTLTLTGFIGRY